jgi:hypothetical protein
LVPVNHPTLKASQNLSAGESVDGMKCHVATNGPNLQICEKILWPLQGGSFWIGQPAALPAKDAGFAAGYIL